MPRNRTMKVMEECNVPSGEDPEYGAIFMSSSSTRKECLRRKLFGLPSRQANFVKQVKAGMILFLFDFESRELHGVFQARSDGAIDIEPNAFCSSGKQFPAQVKFYEKWRCRPLRESEFCHAISENYYTGQKFNFGLSKEQVKKLLSLFSLNKVESPRLRKTAAEKPTRQRETNLRNTAGDRETNLRNTAGDRGFEDRRAGETNRDVEREFPVRVTSAGDPFGRRSTTDYGLGDTFDTDQDFYTSKGNEYSGDTSGVCRRLVDSQMHGLKGSVGDDCNMNNDSYGTNASAIYSDYSLTNDRRVPKNLRDTANGWSENVFHEKDGFAEGRPWSNQKSRLRFVPDPVVPPQSSPYGTNTGYYDPCDPGIMGGPMMKSSRHAPTLDSIGSAYSNIPGGGYFSETLAPETVQPYADEHNGKSKDKTSGLGMDLLYIPMPTEHTQYQTNTGQLHHSQFPGLSSGGASDNFERPSYSRDSIFPSFAYPLSGRDLSPTDRVYQNQEGHGSYSKDTLIRDSRIYPSFTYPSTAEDRIDLHSENRLGAYQTHDESRFDPFDSNNRVIGREDGVNPAEVERKRARKSVFTRLALPSKKRDPEKDTSRETESVEEVMDFLNDCHKQWREQKRPNMPTRRDDFGKSKTKKEKIRTREVLDSDLMPPCTETTPDDLFDSEESMEHGAQKRPFIDFKRRSKAQKNLDNPTQGCNDSAAERSAPQEKKRKLLRPKLIEDYSEKERVNNDHPNENVLASQSACEVLVRDLHGLGDQMKVGTTHGLSV